MPCHHIWLHALHTFIDGPVSIVRVPCIYDLVFQSDHYLRLTEGFTQTIHDDPNDAIINMVEIDK